MNGVRFLYICNCRLEHCDAPILHDRTQAAFANRRRFQYRPAYIMKAYQYPGKGYR